MLKVQLIAHTPEPEKVVASAAKLCYSGVSIDQLMAGLTPEKSREFVKMLAAEFGMPEENINPGAYYE